MNGPYLTRRGRRAAAAAAAPQPPTQAEQRAARRKRVPVEYDGAFDLAAEVDEVCTPLAQRVAELAGSVHLVQPEVLALTAAVHRAVGDLVRQHAVVVARTRTQHLAESAALAARRALVDAVEIAPAPVVDDDALRSGAWAAALVRQAAAIAPEVARFLTPGVIVAARGPSWNDRVLVALRPVDTAALDLDRRLDVLARARRDRQAAAARTTAASPVEQARKLLAELGIEPITHGGQQ